jgi:hypothetical protein
MHRNQHSNRTMVKLHKASDGHALLHSGKRKRVSDRSKARARATSTCTDPRGLQQLQPGPSYSSFGGADLGMLFRAERDRVDRQLNVIRAQIAVIDPAQPVEAPARVQAAPATAAPKSPVASGIPPGHPLEEFIASRLDTTKSWAEVPVGVVARAYKIWASDQSNHVAMNHIRFSRAMTEFYPRKGCVNLRVYTGLALASKPAEKDNPPTPTMRSGPEHDGPSSGSDPGSGTSRSRSLASCDSPRSGKDEDYTRMSARRLHD